jgi:hypothetical protein
MKTFLQSLCLAGALLVAQNLCAQSFDGGSGTPEDPYLISTAAQLNLIRGGGNENRSFKLANDIDLGAWIANNAEQDIKDKGWNPVDAYRGVFDGDGFKITGLWINRPGSSVGLFYQVNVGGDQSPTIKNLTLEIDNEKKVIGGGNTAALIGRVNGGSIPVKIINCHVKGDIEGNDLAIGGFVGRMQDTPLEIIDCSFEGTVTGISRYVGAIIGQKYEGDATFLMKGCYSIDSHISSGDGVVGGLAGVVGKNSTIEDCYTVGGLVTSTGGSVGGLVGNLAHNADNGYLSITRSFTTNDITGTGTVGGIVGEIRVSGGSTATINISQCYTVGEITGEGSVGGIVGGYYNTNGAVLSECYSTSKVTCSGWNVGGLVGYLPGNENTNATIEKSFALNSAIAAAEGGGNAGAFAGSADNTTFTNCYGLNTLQSLQGGVPATFITKKQVCTQAIYETAGWDFTDDWVFGNESYKLPILKGLSGQPEEQPAHLVVSTDATLSNLTVNKGTLDPAFNAETKAYTVDVANNVTSITITATAKDAKATISGAGVKNNLETGSTDFPITVTAEDGITTEIYTITVNRTPLSIRDVQSDPVYYQVKGRSILVTGAEGVATLTNAAGLSKKYVSKGNTINIPVNAAGVYVLTVNQVSYKILIP